MIIHSSGNVRESRYYLQQAGAEARERLLLAAANEWGVPVSELVAKDSVITHAKTKRRTTYGAIAAKAARTPLPDPSKIKIKTPDQFTLLGTEQKSLDVPLKVTGEAIYGIDIRLPGMLYAAAKACPVWGGDVKSYDFDRIKNMPGVHSAVRLPFDAQTKSVGFLGGGDGSNGNGPQGEQAVAVANAVRGRPVKMLWTREEDWGTGTRYRPMSVCFFKAGLDAEGWPIAMEVRHSTTWNLGDMGYRGLSAPPYFVPNYRLTLHAPKTHLPIGTRRGTGAAPNRFYTDRFSDELAHAAGRDPYSYRRELIARNPAEPRLGIGGFAYRDDFLKALDMAAEMSGWGTPLPEGWAR